MSSFKELISKLLEVWLECSLDYDKFWEYSFKDITTILDAQQKIFEQKNKETYDLAYMIAMFVGIVFSGKKIPKYESCIAKEQPTDQDIVKILFVDYMDSWNALRRTDNAQRNR